MKQIHVDLRAWPRHERTLSLQMKVPLLPEEQVLLLHEQVLPHRWGLSMVMWE